MYKIDKDIKGIKKLDECNFSDVGIREREHLQEWIAKNPEVLGEDLLIIQKEYSGFNDTNERLDLLALDKTGGLVIIENKLDDSGRDVVWQGLKYTSYCSTLSTTEIIRIYQEYLNGQTVIEDAKEMLLEFLDWNEDDLILNTNDQRVIFVANHYRKEVTSTVLWLLKHDVQIQCFRATPYSMGEDLFLQIEQIIPLPETKEFMIDAAQKEKEEKGKSQKVKETDRRLIEFWSSLKSNLSLNNIKLIDNVTPKSEFNIGSYSGAGRYNYCIGKKSIRVELYFGNDADKKWFDALHMHRGQIEEKFDGDLLWDRKDGKKASRLAYEMTEAEWNSMEGTFQEKTNWEYQIKWFTDNMEKFYKVVNPIWKKIK